MKVFKNNNFQFELFDYEVINCPMERALLITPVIQCAQALLTDLCTDLMKQETIPLML